MVYLCMACKSRIIMNRIDRLSAILIHLQSKQVVTAGELARRFNVSNRTIYRDIRALEESGVPVGGEAGKGYYLIEGYHLPPVMFSREEAGAFLMAAKLVEKQADVSVKNHFESGLYKLRSILRNTDKHFLECLESRISVMGGHDDQSHQVSNNYSATVMEALAAHKVLQLSYKAGYSGEETSRLVEPMSLVHYSFDWHMMAWCRLRNDFRDFRLDRIKALEITDIDYAERKWDADDYFDRLMQQEEMQLVTLRFSKSICATIAKTRFYFGFIREREVTDKTVEMDFLVNDLDYIAGWLLSLGDRVQVVQPSELSVLLCERVKTLSAHYKIFQHV
ncbi:YafY family transcriptional regulator [Marinilabiliaceae bacterium JC017]|nr:YafY family transcriptional regulator [Marinilabiliaceae bacterium JC017]